MSDPDISVVVPTRNRAPLLRRLLEQLLRIDDHLSYELIVIDEASSDATPKVTAELAASHGVRVARHDKPRGLSGARNVGLQMARAPWVAWIDDDDLTSTDRLRRQYEALTTSSAGWSCAARVDIDDDLNVVGHMQCPEPEGIQARILRSNPLPSAGQGLLVDRSLAREVGGYDEALNSSEDWDFCIRLSAASEPHFLNEPLVAYRVGHISMSANAARMEASIHAVISKYPDLYARHGVQPDAHAIHHSLLNAELAGSRRRAVARAWKTMRAQPSAKAAALIGAIMISPEAVRRRSRRRRVEQVPAEWEAQARRWLNQIPTVNPEPGL